MRYYCKKKIYIYNFLKSQHKTNISRCESGHDIRPNRNHSETLHWNEQPSTLQPSTDWGWAGEEIRGCLPFQAERSRPGSVSMTKADRQPALMHKTWAGKVGLNRANYLFFFRRNLRLSDRMSESALGLHHVNQVAIFTPLTGDGGTPGIRPPHSVETVTCEALPKINSR